MEVERVAVVMRDADDDLLGIAERRNPGQHVARRARNGEGDVDVAVSASTTTGPENVLTPWSTANLGVLGARCRAGGLTSVGTVSQVKPPSSDRLIHLRLEHEVVVAEEDLAVAAVREAHCRSCSTPTPCCVKVSNRSVERETAEVRNAQVGGVAHVRQP